jgi:hypothetical protein
MLLSHLFRALLFGAAAGWLSALISDLETGWVLYVSALVLATAGSWVLVRPMERNTALAALVLWASAGGVFYLLRPPAEFGLLGAAEGFGAYANLAAVIFCFGIGALLGRALARP